jgi:adenine specific DNA methylase Mod
LDEERQISEVVGVGREDEQCSSKLSNRIKSTMPLPRQDVIRILESKEFRILDKAKCQLKYYGIPEEAILKFHLDGKIEIAKSQPRKQPNPFYVISGKIADKPYEVTYIVGDNRTRIQDIEGTSPADCTEQNAE